MTFSLRVSRVFASHSTECRIRFFTHQLLLVLRHKEKINNMASFFDLKARQAAAAAAGPSKQSANKQQDNRQQPWVEK